MIELVVTLLALVVAGLVVVGYASTRPTKYRVTRSRVIKASDREVFAIIEDLHRWTDWSPWDKMDPAVTRTYEGAERGEGAIYRWSGNKKVGKGSMQILSAVEASKVEIDLQFVTPFPAQCLTAFTIEPQPEGTKVTWTMDGTNNLMAKIFGLFVNMDVMLGRDFENGLASMDDKLTRAANQQPNASS